MGVGSVARDVGLNSSPPFSSFPSGPGRLSAVSSSFDLCPFNCSLFYFIFNNILYCDEDSRFAVLLLTPSLSLLALPLLVDSGACCTCVNTAWARGHNFRIDSEYESNTLSTACGTSVVVRGVIVLVLYFGGNVVIRCKARVVDGLSYDVILGRDVLGELDLAVHVHNKGQPQLRQRGLCSVCSASVGSFTSLLPSQPAPQFVPVTHTSVSLCAPPVSPPPQLPVRRP